MIRGWDVMGTWLGVRLTCDEAGSRPLLLWETPDVRPHLGRGLHEGLVDILQHGVRRVEPRVEEHQVTLDLERIYATMGGKRLVR